jgi:hypothetical protein
MNSYYYYFNLPAVPSSRRNKQVSTNQRIMYLNENRLVLSLTPVQKINSDSSNISISN